MVVPGLVIGVSLFYVFAKVGLLASDLGIALGHKVHTIPSPGPTWVEGKGIQRPAELYGARQVYQRLPR
jgi:hypothetical protein